MPWPGTAGTLGIDGAETAGAGDTCHPAGQADQVAGRFHKGVAAARWLCARPGLDRLGGLKRGISAMLLAVAYSYEAVICTAIINDGGPSWLCLLVLLFF